MKLILLIFLASAMGQIAKKISGIDVDNLLQMLNEALAEEWLAYYQYWVGARVMEGPMRTEVEAELLVHADEELNHANMVATRIIQLGGMPVLNPNKWEELARCKYEEPNDPYVEKILEQNLRGERCAIQRYQELADYTQGKDHSTYTMAVTILDEEIEHEDDIEAWLADLARLKDDIIKLRFNNTQVNGE